jgi:hypothetical protein
MLLLTDMGDASGQEGTVNQGLGAVPASRPVKPIARVGSDTRSHAHDRARTEIRYFPVPVGR